MKVMKNKYFEGLVMKGQFIFIKYFIDVENFKKEKQRKNNNKLQQRIELRKFMDKQMENSNQRTSN